MRVLRSAFVRATIRLPQSRTMTATTENIFFVAALVVVAGAYLWLRIRYIKPALRIPSIPWTPEAVQEVVGLEGRLSPEELRKIAQGFADLPQAMRSDFPPEIQAFLQRQLGNKTH